jgi:hypothetical protein
MSMNNDNMLCMRNGKDGTARRTDRYARRVADTYQLCASHTSCCCQSIFMVIQPVVMQTQHWMPLMIDFVDASTSAPRQLLGALVILSSCTHAAFEAGKDFEEGLLTRISQWLASREVRSIQDTASQRQLMMFVANLVDAAGPSAQNVACPLLHVLLHLQGSLQEDQYAVEQIKEVWVVARVCWHCDARHLLPLLIAEAGVNLKCFKCLGLSAGQRILTQTVAH